MAFDVELKISALEKAYDELMAEHKKLVARVEAIEKRLMLKEVIG